ncbi:MAG: efflux RND transporter permease subunit, partial [Planctomycetes bacterium]|nr:efflux RND transporter permease subunit [Planctomycetota bacterium]
MARAIISWCLRNPVLVGFLSIAVLAWGAWAMAHTPVDAIPDIGEKQVIVFADWPGRSPQDVEEQVTYPLTAALEGTPQVKTIRSMSSLGFSMVFVIFRDEADYYWARSRVLERLSSAQGRLPEGVVPVLGPDATALGQVFWYTLEGEGFSLEELRTAQDWFVRYQLNAVEGVSEVASIGGHVREYQIDVDPEAMRAHRVTLRDVFEAVRRSNLDVGAKVIERNGVEFFVRGVGFVKSVADIESIVLRSERGTPLCIRNVARVTLGPEFRRGALDKEGAEAVGGIVLMRFGANPREVIRAVSARAEHLAPGLPEKLLPDGRRSKVRLVPYYDRSVIIEETIGTLKEALTEELLAAGLVVLVFLLHLRASLSILATLPLSMALAFLAMYYLGVDANIMSLAGLAIAIGDVADMGIIMTENIYRALASRGGDRLTKEERLRVVEEAAHEVGPAILTAVTNTILSFIPVFFLEAEEGKLFKPLAYTKTFAISACVVLAITVVPSLALLTLREISWRRRARWSVALACGALAAWGFHSLAAWSSAGPAGGLAGGLAGWPTAAATGIVIFLAVLRMTSETLRPLERNPVSRFIAWTYEPTLRWILAHKKTFMAIPVSLLVLGASIWLGFDTVFAPLRAVGKAAGWDPGMSRPWVAARHAFPGLGREFMPPLDEGSFLYMPSLLPAGSLTQALEMIGKQNAAIRRVPEVLDVVGKIGRAESALDPAPIGMVETIVTLRPESEWREVPVRRWFSDWPGALKSPLARLWPERRRITKDEIRDELAEATALPGVLPSWLQPIETRLVMLSTGFRAMMGIKVFGPDLHEIERICVEMEAALREVPGAVDVIADRIAGKPYVEYEIDREAAARYGVSIMDVQEVIETAIGGERLTTTVEGAARYPVRVRYPRELRDSLEALDGILVPAMNGAQVPLSSVAHVRFTLGPQEIKSENTLKVGYVTFNTRDRDEVSVVEDAKRLLKARIDAGTIRLPDGYYWVAAGRYEAQVRAVARLKILIPVVLALMFLSLYLGFGTWWIALVVFFGTVVSLSGGFLMLWMWGVNLSVAVWVGMIALLGVADDDAVVILTYLEQRFRGKTPRTVAEVRDWVVEAGLKRIRPCLMTTATTVFGLIPVFTTHGRGSDVMVPMAIPSVGGMFISLITLFIAPCLY